ncbi:MAG UNVERIFIED_CONTAM: putative selenium-dependent hydroxylase accessory protein YqeC [Anaerolineae bacterium]|jgi:probable selenium-dependent hydroxylase accessory protein YqeC
MKLIDALELKRGDVVSLIGSGGKTSSLVAMMHECQARGWRVLMTTTTRIGVSELSHFPTHTHSGAVASYRESSSVFVYNHYDSSKVYGLDETELITAITDFQPDLVLIEADGSRKKSLKIPYSHEPVRSNHYNESSGDSGVIRVREALHRIKRL